jgi:hypothetical protein
MTAAEQMPPNAVHQPQITATEGLHSARFGAMTCLAVA